MRTDLRCENEMDLCGEDVLSCVVLPSSSSGGMLEENRCPSPDPFSIILCCPALSC